MAAALVLMFVVLLLESIGLAVLAVAIREQQMAIDFLIEDRKVLLDRIARVESSVESIPE